MPPPRYQIIGFDTLGKPPDPRRRIIFTDTTTGDTREYFIPDDVLQEMRAITQILAMHLNTNRSEIEWRVSLNR